MNLTLGYLILLLINENHTLNQCDIWSQKHLFNSTEYHVPNIVFPFVRIDSLQNLNFKFESCTKIEIKHKGLKVYFNIKSLFDNDFKIHNFLNFFSEKQNFILFVNVKGFNQKIFMKENNLVLFQLEYNFVNVNFRFFQNETLVTEDKCKRKNFDQKIKSFFGDMQYLTINDNVLYNEKICPYVFLNAKLVQLRLFQIAKSLIFMNRLEILDVNETADFDLNINSLELYNINVAYEIISLKNFNKHIFKK